MTVDSDINSNDYLGNGSTTVFPYTFKVFAVTDLLVTTQDLTGHETVLVLGTDYTVPGFIADAAGSITLAVALPGDGTETNSHKLNVSRSLTALQPADFTSQGTMRANVVERALDRSIMLIQQLEEKLARSITVPITDTGVSLELPPKALRASSQVIVDSEGNVTTGSAPSSGVISSAMQPIVSSATIAVARKRLNPWEFYVRDYLAKGNSTDDDTSAIQSCIEAAHAFSSSANRFSNPTVSFTPSSNRVESVPWSGMDGGGPVIVFEPGRYRITETLYLYTGMTVRGTAAPSRTESHTVIMMDEAYGTVANPTYTLANIANGTGVAGTAQLEKAIFKFRRNTIDNPLQSINGFVTVAIHNLEFWYVLEGGTSYQPKRLGVTPRANAGAALYFDVPTNDSWITDCVFQHMPACIRVKDLPSDNSVAPDGLPHSGGFNLFVKRCEFDAGGQHIWASNVTAANSFSLHLSDCEMFGSEVYLDNVKATTVSMTGCVTQFEQINTTDTTTIGALHVSDNTFVQSDGKTAISVLGSVSYPNISVNTFLGATGKSTIEIRNADGGCISTNVIIDSGYNSTTANNDTDCAAIKLSGCREVSVTNNTISTPSSGAASFNTYGIFCVDSTGAGGRSSRNNVVLSNTCNGDYNGASYRGQSRSVNVTTTDRVLINFDRRAAASVNSYGIRDRLTMALKTSDRIDAYGSDIAPSGSQLGATQDWDLDAIFTEDGMYIVQCVTSPTSAPASRNFALLMFSKRGAGGSRLTAITIDNTGSATGATISVVPANTLRVTIGATGVYYAYISYHKLGGASP